MSATEKTDFPALFQQEDMKSILEDERVLIAHEMGVGKTASPILAHYLMKQEGYDPKTLVVSPGYLRDHWEEEIYSITEDDPDVEKIEEYEEELFEAAGDSEFTVVNYSALGENQRGFNVTDKLLENSYDLLVLDESHNAKNPEAYRSQEARKLSENIDRLALLSGTPIPDSLADAYMQIYMLEPDSYESPEEVKEMHRDEPRTLRAVFKQRRRQVELSEVAEVPEIEQREEKFELDRLHQEIYDSVLGNDWLGPNKKLHQLIAAVNDPELINTSHIYGEEQVELLSEAESSKYKVLDEIVQEKLEEDEKIVVYSPHLRDNVTEKLEERYSEYGSIRIDGQIPQEERSSLVEEFNQGDSQILVATPETAGEGIDLTSANNVIFLQEPYNPAIREQAVKRVVRRGQNQPVEVISLQAEDTIDEGLAKYQEQKEKALEFVENGEELSSLQWNLLMDRNPGVLETPLQEEIRTPQQKVRHYLSRISGDSIREFWRRLSQNDFETGEELAGYQAEDWEGSYSYNAAKVYSEIVEDIAPENARIFDIGSGHGGLSHMLEQEVVNVDINPKVLEQDEQAGDNGIMATMDHLPIQDDAVDVAASTLSLPFTSQTRERPFEREQTVREANRILNDGGKYVIALPRHLITEENVTSMHEGLEHFGFKIDEHNSGIFRPGNPEIDFETLIITGTRAGEPCEQYGQHFRLSEADTEDRKWGMRNSGEVEEFEREALESFT